MLLIVPHSVILSPYNVFVYHRIKDPPALKGRLRENNYLTKSEKLFENEILGPESIVFKDGKTSSMQ